MNEDAILHFHPISLFLPSGGVDLKSLWGNMLTFTNGTAAWSTQASPFLERETALLAKGRFHTKPPVMCRLFNMDEMIKDFFFFDPEQFRNLSQIKSVSFQGFSNFFPQG